MSKAFTDEETPEAGPLARPPPRLLPGEVRYVTPEGKGALEDALRGLRAERDRLRALPEAHRASRAPELEARIRTAEATLASLTVLGPEEAPEGVAAFGTWVTVQEGALPPVTWRLVGPDEADPRWGLLSAHSPVGRAILGRGAGEAVEVVRPGGGVVLRIVRVWRSPP